MSELLFFFDYECPYCKTGYEYFLEEIKNYPKIEVTWLPVESHPLPEEHLPHTYLACQSFYIAQELGADMNAFHAAMYQAVSIERQDVEKPEVLAEILKDIINTEKLLAILKSGKYAKQIDENNDLAYEKSEVWYVPAFRMNGKKLNAQGGIGITQKELRKFLRG
jgi:predicted DsbA family dithiol-disulfide isomerase